MTYRQFLQTYIYPNLASYDKNHNDKPYNRQVFNDALDCCKKNGDITEKQATTWIYPQTKRFV